MTEKKSVGSQIVRLLRHSAVYGIGHIVTRSLGFLLLPLYTNTIPTDEFGKAMLLFSFMGIMNVFYGYGMDVAYLRYVALQEDLHKQRILFSTGFISLLVTSFILSCSLVLLQQPVSTIIFHSTLAAKFILLCSGILFFDAMGLMPFMALRAKEKSVPFILLKLANVIVNIGGNIVFILVLKWGIIGIFWANLCSSALTFVLLSPILIRYFTFHFDRGVFSEMIRFGLPYVPSGLAVVAMDLIDRFFLERMTNLDITGIYSAGYKLGMFMALFIAAFRFAWHPFFLSTSRQENAKQVFARVLTYFVLACSLVFLTISFFIDEIVRFQLFGFTIFGKDYWASTVIVPLILISYILYGVYVNFLVGVYLEKKTAWLPLITGSAAIVNIVGNLLLIPFLGMMGSAWAKVACYAAMAFLLYIKIHRVYFVRYEWSRIVRVATGAIAVFLLQHYLFQFQTWWLKLGLILVFGLLLLASGFLDRSEKSHLQNLLKRAVSHAQ